MEKEFTNMYDDFKNPIHIGDELRSEYGYNVIVQHYDDGSYYGKLKCKPNHPCANIPYSLNNGKGYVQIKFFNQTKKLFKTLNEKYKFV